MTTLALCRRPYIVYVTNRCCFTVQKRHRYKKKWAVNLPSKTPCELALDHFDAFYRPIYGKRWPSIRVSLLSLPKYAALVNNASERNQSIDALTELGARDVISIAAQRMVEKKETSQSVLANSSFAIDGDRIQSESGNGGTKSHFGDGVLSKKNGKRNLDQSEDVSEEQLSDTGNGSCSSESLLNHLASRKQQGSLESRHMDNVLPPDAAMHSKDLQYFVPTEQVFSEKEQLLREELQMSTFEERPISVSRLPGQLPSLPASLKVFTFPSGDVSDFPRPRADQAGLLNYYLLDAASILPVIALDLQPHDSVLDLCAAPGGKTLAMLQMIITQKGHLTSSDSAQGRVRRLETVLRSYLSQSLLAEFVNVKQQNGTAYRDPVFSKVLVDVPCNSDRHVLSEEDNNLFKPGRITDRLKMTTLQKNLLLAGIRSCKPGGSVVYSTCTLAAVQNDGVVQAAVEELWEISDIDVAVEDLSSMANLFTDTFTFHSGTRFGQLVLPCLTNNFGPMYFCKLRRLS